MQKLYHYIAVIIFVTTYSKKNYYQIALVFRHTKFEK